MGVAKRMGVELVVRCLDVKSPRKVEAFVAPMEGERSVNGRIVSKEFNGMACAISMEELDIVKVMDV